MEAVSTGMPETPRLWRYGVGATVFSVLVLGSMALYARGLGTINGYMPHGHCYLWQSPLVGLHVGSDTVIAISYLAISATLAYLVHRSRDDIPFHWMILAFGGFIVACGATHAFEVWTLWNPNYWLSGGVKLFTAAVSLITAIALPPLVPRILRLVRADRLARHHEERFVEGSQKLAAEQAARADLEAARAAAEAESQAKDDFLAMVSHELRTPLSPLLAWARMLQQGQVDADQRQRALEVMERNARLLAQLIDDLLDVSRIVSGKLRLDVQPLDLEPVVEAATESVRAMADARRVRLEITCENTPCVVRGDAARLQQVAWNLLSNAIKCTPSGGLVRTHLARVGDRVELTVSDTGIGIPHDALPFVFERFWQGPGLRAEQRRGLGLGLAIVRHLTELHGGSVSVFSEGEGRGARFVISLPATAAAGAAEVAPDEASTHFARLDGVRVLVVDNDPDANESLRVLLTSCGAEVRVAVSAGQALDLLGRWAPDVLVSDIEMPGDDGYALMRRVRANPRRALPAIALTAHARAEDRARAFEAGFQRHLAKPCNPTELVEAVALLARR